ncbi:hypothetical protein ACA910_009876 [Epithemia clementina (nom. ined.)]
MKRWAVVVTLIQASSLVRSLELPTVAQTRRQAVGSWVSTIVGVASLAEEPLEAFSDDGPSSSSSSSIINFEGRNRNGNKDAVIREDYWYMFGKTPPRVLTTQLRGDDPQWNAFGSCTQSDGGNSCTYVSLNQRIPAYSKYGASIAYGAREFGKLGQVLLQLKGKQQQQQATSTDAMTLWDAAASYVDLPQERQLPPGPVDAELKLVLFATAMTTSPNFPQPGKELLVARFYANEVRYANRQILAAIQERNLPRSIEAWEFGRDSWNSYFQVVNRSISPKVGDKFEPISLDIDSI